MLPASVKGGVKGILWTACCCQKVRNRFLLQFFKIIPCMPGIMPLQSEKRVQANTNECRQVGLGLKFWVNYQLKRFEQSQRSEKN